MYIMKNHIFGKREITMRKTICIFIAGMLALSSVACAKPYEKTETTASMETQEATTDTSAADTTTAMDTNTDTTPDDESTGASDGDVISCGAVNITSSVEFLTQVWDAFGEENQFAAAGGDAEHEAEGPGKFALTAENKDSFEYLLHVNDALYAMLDDDAATLQHMMNTNTFSVAAAKLKDASQAEAFAEAYKAEVQNQHWMCGFPDKVVVISVGDYVVFGFGIDECIDALESACATVVPDRTVLVDAPAVVD